MVKRAHIFMLLLIIYISALSSILPVFFSPETHVIALQNTYIILAFLIPFGMYMAVTKQKLSEVLPLKGLSIVNILFIICITIAAIPATMVISALSAFIFGSNVAVFLSEIISLPAIIVVISVAFIPSVVEEITFRGIILSDLKQLGKKKSAVVSGFFFGLIHMDLQQFPYAFLLGIVFAYFVHYTKSILAPMLAHFIINSFSVFWAYTFVDLDIAADPISLSDVLISMPMISALFISIPAFYLAFRQFILHNEKNIAEEIEI